VRFVRKLLILIDTSSQNLQNKILSLSWRLSVFILAPRLTDNLYSALNIYMIFNERGVVKDVRHDREGSPTYFCAEAGASNAPETAVHGAYKSRFLAYSRRRCASPPNGSE